MDVGSLSEERLENLIKNHRRLGKTEEPLYREALAEHARRQGKGLDFKTTISVIGQAAREGRYISYGQVAEASGANWNKVHFAMGPHLDSLLEYCHLTGLPLLTAIVVNQQNLDTGKLEPDSLKGFIAGVKKLGITVVDQQKFLEDQQRRIFEWAASESGH
jgi:hypothetical protein